MAAVVTELACIVKTKRDGSVKIRLVIDLRRSGVNELSDVPQKVNLPRVKDFTISVVNLFVASTCQICLALTWAASTSLMPSIPSQIASTQRVFFPDPLRPVHPQSHPVWPCLQSLVEGARFSSSFSCGSVNVLARGAQSPNVRGRPCVGL